MKKTGIFLVSLIMVFMIQAAPAFADEPTYPAYLLKAQSQVQKAASAASELSSVTDDVLIAQNLVRNAEAEFKKNLSWTGKLEATAEPTVRYFASMAELQASFVLSRAAKNQQEKELKAIEGQIAQVKSKIKVFDDKNEEIAALKKGITELNSELLALKSEKEQFIAKVAALEGNLATVSITLKTSQQKGTTLTTEAERCQASLVSSEKKIVELTAELDTSRNAAKSERESLNSEVALLKQELSKLALAKGMSESQSREQIEALNRQKDFVNEVGKLGGVIKPGSDNMTVIFVRSGILKAPKNDALTVDGDKVTERVVALLKKYSEFRIKLKVHGYGAPAKSEDASATDRMARLIRETLLVKGAFDPSMIEALGAGAAEPIYPKSNPEGNRRVEITFVKR